MKLLHKILLRIADLFPFLDAIPLFRILGILLLIVAWISGEVHGWLAWSLLLVMIDFKIDIYRNGN